MRELLALHRPLLCLPQSSLGCTNIPDIPPGCHSFYSDTGYFSEWLIDCYVSCLGATETEEGSWSQIKAMYR